MKKEFFKKKVSSFQKKLNQFFSNIQNLKMKKISRNLRFLNVYLNALNTLFTTLKSEKLRFLHILNGIYIYLLKVTL